MPDRGTRTTLPAQPARERLLDEMVEALRKSPEAPLDLSYRDMAEICLGVIERPSDPASETIIPCTCGQNGYAPISPHSNHPHYPKCSHYDEAVFQAWSAELGGRIICNHATRDIKPVGQCPGCDLYHAGKKPTKETE